jgi:signal transduction histidine kinase
VERLRARAEQAGSQLVVSVPEIYGRWDRTRIDQVISNLLTNAIKYGRGRPVRVVGGIDGAQAHLEISDEGIGVSQDDIDRIFGKFERAVPSQYGGLGLGLFIARQIVEAHGGRITAANLAGPDGGVAGARFEVTLPLARRTA